MSKPKLIAAYSTEINFFRPWFIAEQDIIFALHSPHLFLDSRFESRLDDLVNGIDDRRDGGTRIAVLPDRLQLICIVRDQGNVTSIVASSHHPASTKRKNVLIADDSELVRTMIRQALERDTDFAVCGEAADGTDAVSKAKELSPDLIILDVRMPGLNGIEVAGILRYALPKIRIVLVTMYAEDLEKNLTSLFRIDAVLDKADGLTEMTEYVSGLLDDCQPEIATAPDLDGDLTLRQKVIRAGNDSD
jgi:CheY-like chemotaxis protein